MEEMITYDFKFEDFSKRLGEFYVECADSHPDGKIERVTYHYPYEKGKIFLSFKCPENVAVVLKLRFGDCITIRPPKKDPEPDSKDSSFSNLIKMKYIKSRNYYEDYEKLKYISELKITQQDYMDYLEKFKVYLEEI